mgnify:FL=1
MLVAGQQCQHLPDAEWEAASIKGRCRTFPNDGDWALADALAPAGIGQKRTDQTWSEFADISGLWLSSKAGAIQRGQYRSAV